MNKADFKKVRGIATIANLSFALLLCLIASIVFWIWKSSIEIMFISMIGFSVLYTISWVLNIIAAQRLKEMKFTGETKRLVNMAIKQSWWFPITIPFTVTMNRIRSSMWEEHIENAMKDIESPVERVRVSTIFLEDLKEDGFVSQKEYDKRKAHLQEAKKEAEKFEKENPSLIKKKIVKKTKAKKVVKSKVEESDGDEWI